jgi:hypothetical protein
MLSVFGIVLSHDALPQIPPQINIPQAISEMDRELASHFAKAGLQGTVVSMFNARRQLRPGGYEDRTSFQQQFDVAFKALHQGLWIEGALSGYAKRMLNDKQTVSILESRLKTNAAAFEKFRQQWLSSGIPVPLYLRSAPPDYLLRAQLYFAVIAGGVNPLALPTWITETTIWPFC